MDLKKRVHRILAQSGNQVDAVFGPSTYDTGVSSVFKEVPVNFKTFVESVEHMGFPPLSERQLDVARFMLGDDPMNTFNNENTLAVLLWGKGAGKDAMACLIILYVVYYCLSLKDPQKFFGLPSGECIDLLNVAYSSAQASEVFFEKFRQRVIRWQWLKKRYTIKLSGVYAKQIKEEDIAKAHVTITRDGIIFPNSIRAFSGHSQQESLEGRNLLAFCMDEACFRSTQGIVLADGTREQIRTIVNKKLSVEVLSYNFTTKTIEPKKVVNWFKYPYYGQMLRVKLNDRKYKRSKFINCTPNHHIYLPDGSVVRADQLSVGQNICVKGRFLSETQLQILYGTLLGDSSLQKGSSKGNATPQLTFGHGQDQLSYLNWKVAAFQKLIFTKPRGYPGGYQPNKLCYSSNVTYFEQIDDVYKLIHSGPVPRKKYVSQQWLDKLTPLGLAIWYLDDGTLQYSKTKIPHPMVSFCIAQCTKEEALLICNHFNEKLKYEAYLCAGQRDDKQGYTLYLRKSGSKKFLDDIAPFVPSSMQYKSIHPATFVWKDDSTDFAILPIQQITEYDVPHSFVYDIEVADNHNYFAGDILVSNSAFKDKTETHNADKIFSVLQSSATSRFGTRWKAFVLSYPRYKGDFTEKMLDIAESELHWYSDKGATWDIKPLRYFSGRWVDFEGTKIPKEFEKEFKRDPLEAKCKYMCQAPEVEQAFMEYPEKIEACVDYTRKPIVTFESYEEGEFIKKRISEVNSQVDMTEYIATIDLGLKGDSAALSIFHKEQVGESIIFIQDAVTAWIPDRSRNIIVSFVNIEEILSKLKQHVTLTGVYFDQWQSTTLIQRLVQAQIRSEQYKLDFQDYKNFKERVYAGQVKLLPYTDQLVEMKKLVIVKGNKVDHISTSSKDLADTVVGAIKVLTSGGRTGSSIALTEGGEFIGDNLGSEGSFVSTA